jgi:acyl-CoA synthetase (AMP-forming)/AMP-acid ligase II
VIQSVVDRFDAADVLDTVERHRVTALQIVGDAFGRPLLRALDHRARDLGSLRFITSGGTVLSPDVRAELHRHLPGVRIVDIMGSSESGRLAVATHDTGHSTGFVPSEGSVVVDPSRRSLVSVDDDQIGWLATTGPIPLGYLGDPDKTATTFPTIAGTRYTVPGDRARWRPDGTVEVLGRDAAVINSGGEKVFAEEVEAALRSHPAIEDAVVVGRPHPTLGSEVCAVVSLLPGHEPPALADLRTFLGRSLSRYKLPRELAVRPAVQRSPAGKTDYAWAREQIVRPGL